MAGEKAGCPTCVAFVVDDLRLFYGGDWIMLRMKSAAVMVLVSAGVAWGQTPFVANHLVSQAAWMGPEVPFEFMDLPGSDQTLTLPAGTALITWTSTMTPDFEARMRPRIGTDAPVGDTVVRGGRASGSWLTTTAGGSVNVGLQVRSVHVGCCTGQVDTIDSLSWSIMVIPDSAPVPAVSSLGLAVMIVVLLGVGGYVVRRRMPAAA